MSLRFSCRRQKNSQLHLQEGSWQDNEAPGFEWLDRPQLLGSRHTSHQRTIGVIPFRREAPWWSFTGPMAKWQSSLLGCDCYLSFGESYISDAAREPGSVDELAASRKEARYAALDGRYMFVPIAFENLGVPNASAKLLLTHLGRRLFEKSRESRETSFLFQRCSVLL